MPYTVEFAASVEAHFRALTARDRATAIAAINRQLLHEPLKETRNRKPLRPNPVAPWELRVGPLRIFYERLVGRGKPKKAALAAVARKLLVAINAMIRDRRPWEPAVVPESSCC